MTRDARFEDASSGALRLAAETEDDLQVISALCQDAVFPPTEMSFDPKERRFAVLLNRFRWEDETTRPERVQCVLAFDAVTQVRSNGIDRKDEDQILSLLTIELTEDEAQTVVTLVLAGDGAVELRAEVLAATLADVTQPYYAPSGQKPDHQT